MATLGKPPSAEGIEGSNETEVPVEALGSRRARNSWPTLREIKEEGKLMKGAPQSGGSCLLLMLLLLRLWSLSARSREEAGRLTE